jgi:uncharacterized protein (TIGR02246 family)
MRSFLIVCTSLLFSTSAIAAEPDVKQEIEKVVATYSDHFSKKDAAAIATLFTKEGFVVNPAGVHPDVAKYYETAFSNGFDKLDSRVTRVSPMADGTALVVGEANVTGKKPQSGEPIEFRAVWTTVNVRDGGQWKIRMLTTVPKPPAPPTTKQ